jgi:hypothetical protein
MNRWSKAWFQSTQLVRWSGRIAKDRFARSEGPIHILFCMVDHYEPGTGKAGFSQERARMEQLLSNYPKLADAHRDSDNGRPKRTWFFPPHYHRNGNLRDLVSLCEQGYGEIELHLHHGKAEPDTAENLRETIEQTLREYRAFGIFGTENGAARYGFIHGDWALDNSRRNQFCGVNSEISILRDTGCYADFTFPSMNEANPRKVNAVFYATDDPGKPKSHDRGRDAGSHSNPGGDLMIVQGPIHPYFVRSGIGGLRMIGDAVDETLGIAGDRIDMWVRTAVHVEGKRNWVLIKVHTHGAEDAAVVLGRPMEEAFSYMEQHYNDGKRYCLHYVTARELYNIIKAIESGQAGDQPGIYRDFKIAPPGYESTVNAPEASDRLRALIAKTYRG